MTLSVGTTGVIQPETGWQRSQYNEGRLIFIGTDWQLYDDNSGHLIKYKLGSLKHQVKFRFLGTKFRMIGCGSGYYSNQCKVIITSLKTNQIISNYTFNEHCTEDTRNLTLVHESPAIPLDEYEVIIEETSGKNFNINSIDIENTGKFLAYIGQTLTVPEIGWQRIEDTNSIITYEGQWYIQTNNTYSGGSCHYSINKNSIVKFNFTGNKLRIIAGVAPNCSGNITITIDGIKYPFSEYQSSLISSCLLFEKTDLANKEHSFMFCTNDENSSIYSVFDAIDIDSNGILKPYNPNLNKYLIMKNNQYYSVKDNSLTLLGIPTDDTQKEQWFNDYGVDALKAALLIPQSDGSKLIDKLDDKFEIRMMKTKD